MPTPPRAICGQVSSLSIWQQGEPWLLDITVGVETARPPGAGPRRFVVYVRGSVPVLPARLARLPGAVYSSLYRRWVVPPTRGNALALLRIADAWRAAVYPNARFWLESLARG